MAAKKADKEDASSVLIVNLTKALIASQKGKKGKVEEEKKPAKKSRKVKPSLPAFFSGELAGLGPEAARKVKMPAAKVNQAKAQLNCGPTDGVSVVRVMTARNIKLGRTLGDAICHKKPDPLVPRKRCPAELKRKAKAEKASCRTKAFAAPKITDKVKLNKVLAADLQNIYGFKQKKDGTPILDKNKMPVGKSKPKKGKELKLAAVRVAAEQQYKPLTFSKRGKEFTYYKDPSKGIIYAYKFVPKSTDIGPDGLTPSQRAQKRFESNKIVAYVQLNRSNWKPELDAAVAAAPVGSNLREIRRDIIRGKSAAFKASLIAAGESLYFDDAGVIAANAARNDKKALSNAIKVAAEKAAKSTAIIALKNALNTQLKNLGL